MLSMDFPEVELTLSEAATRVRKLESSMEQIRRQRDEENSKRVKQLSEADEAEVWRRQLIDSALAEGNTLDETIAQLNLEIFQATENRNKKIVLHKQEREKMKREAEYIENAGSRMLAFEMRLSQAMASDAKRLATRIKQVHEATKTDLKNKMASLVEMGERQHAKNRTVITKLQADVLAQRAVFWEGSKLRKFGQESTYIVAMPTNADLDAQDAIQHIKSGDTLIRFNNRTGKTEEYWVQVDTSCNFVNWQRLAHNRSGFSKLGNAQTGRIDLVNEAVDVMFGAKSPAFFTDPDRPHVKSWLCFTIITRDRHTYDYMAPDQESATSWFLGLQALIPSNFKIDGSVRNRSMGRGLILWRRGMMKIQHAAMNAHMSPLSYLADRLFSEAVTQGIANEEVFEKVTKRSSVSSIVKQPARSRSASFKSIFSKTKSSSILAVPPPLVIAPSSSHAAVSADTADHEAALLSARGARAIGAPVGRTGQSARQIVLTTPNHPVPAPGEARIEEAGVVALRLAIQQGVMTNTDLLERSDTELQEMITNALRSSEHLRALFRAHLPASQYANDSSDDDDDDEDEEAESKEDEADTESEPNKSTPSKPMPSSQNANQSSDEDGAESDDNKVSESNKSAPATKPPGKPNGVRVTGAA